MNADDIGASRDLLRRLFQLNTKRRCPFRRQASAPCDNGHAKSACTWNHLLTDFADADQPERASIKPACFRKLFLVPFSTSQGDYVVSNSPVECEDQSESKFGNGD